MKVFLSLLSCFALSWARSTGTGQELTDGFNLAVTWNETTSIATFTAVIPDKTYLGIFLGSFSHVNSDTILFSANGASSRFYDMYSDGYFMPLDDDKNDLTGSFTVINKEVKFTVNRKMDTGDRLQDYLMQPDQQILCAWAVNSITSDRRSKHDKNNRFSFELKTTPKVVPTDSSSTNINTAGGTDGTTSWLPAGPKAVKPEYPVAYLSIPQAALTISNYIKSVGWVLDGATSAAQGNELAVERWWAEIAKEQGSEWLNDQYQFAVSGWALYGEIELNAGYPLAVGDYIVAGIQTDPDTDKTRVARVSGQMIPDKFGNKVLSYITQTYSGFDGVMGLSTDPFPESAFTAHEIFCETNFGPNKCNGLNGVFGSDFKSATNSDHGLWKLWLWLPEKSHEQYFDYQLESGDHVTVWAGTYVAAAGSGTAFDTGYWQYGEMLKLKYASFLAVGSTLTGLLALLLF